MINRDKQIKYGAILSYVAIALNVVAGLVYTPWVVRQIGDSQYGLYTLANSLISLFLVDFGLSAATARFLSRYHAEGDEEKVNNFLGVVYKLYLLIDAVIFVVLLVVYFLIDKIYVKLTPLEIEQFKVVYIIAATFAVLNFPFVTQNGILTAYEKFIPIKLADIIYRILFVGLTIIALIMGYGLYALVAMHAVAGLAIILFKFIFIKSGVKVKANFKYSDKILYKQIFNFSVWTTVSLLAQRLIFNITPTILGITADSTAIAVFGIISVIEGYTFTITSAINGMFMPKISKEYVDAEKDGENAEDKIQPLFFSVGRFQYALNGLIIVGFALVGKLFIDLWIKKPGYEQAYLGILLVTIPGLFFNSLQIANTTLVVRNKVKLQAFINLITGVVNVILSVVLSRFYGVIGACVSIFIAYTVRAVITNIVAKTVLHFDMKGFIGACYIRMSIPILLTLALGLIANHFVKINGWIGLIIEALIIVIIYLIFVFLFGLNKEERKNIIQIVKNKFIKTK